MIFSYIEFVLLLFIVIISVGLIGNLMLIYIVFCWLEMRILCNYLIVNNVFVDFCVVFIGVFMWIVEVYYGWFFGELVC